ncbi:MAG: hypothetical protein LBB60_04145 [Desulfovibrio sp.]|jgi:choline dehydrogenase-like flavoprotein|nr:hypothetical protein [Desulfovibrio sp.]
MDLFNFLIVGSGPSGMAVARILEKRGTCLVDAGDLPQAQFPYASLTEAAASGDFSALMGEHWEALANIRDPHAVHTKMKSQALRFIASGEPVEVYGDSETILLKVAGSYAAGGMSNTWGAQLVRYTDADLDKAGDWPLEVSALSPYYADLEEHIGIAGAVDDMYDFLGEVHGLLSPPPLVPCAQYLLARYESAKKTALESMLLGRPRLGLLTTKYKGYEPYKFCETEFFTSGQSGIYTAKRTLDDLRQKNNMVFYERHKLLSYTENEDHVAATVLDCKRNEKITIKAHHLLLGCGTLHTARLVLLNRGETGRTLPFIDHPPTLVPIFFPRMFGSILPSRSFPVQLAATLKESPTRELISLYYPGAVLWSDLLPETPLPVSSALRLFKNMFGGMLVAQIWETSTPQKANVLELDDSGALRIRYPDYNKYTNLKKLLKIFRRLGGWSLQRFASMPMPGRGFHYAGSLPMKDAPEPYQTHTDGRLWDSRRVYIIDAAALPSLPAKNHSLTMMANAARIADRILQCECSY